ncbi:ABC transporter permease [Paenibacillus marchantiophytorum]|uniref:ABC transporter permease n=1 Tax=Paenibacillus marchantiophytorum TaxID=1619310 RepID=A0ABQ2BT53_9BACL|nr:ABC transporter permease [Paenibacillus marchantiophytorum]GGI45666.1 ABC transporter permease [Paenibacillus marchantiophytorum]
MLRLIQNEFLKLHAKKSMYVFIGVLVLLELAAAFAIKPWMPLAEKFTGFLSFSNTVFVPIVLLTTIFGIAIASRVVSEEFQTGTIKQLLIRPRKRITILLSKYFTVVFVLIFVCSIALLLSMAIGIVLFGRGKEELTFVMLLKIVCYQILPMLFYPTVSFFLANFFRKSVLPLIIALFIFFLEGVIVKFLPMMFKKYLIFSHLDLAMYDSNILINGGAMPPSLDFNFTASLLFVSLHFVVLLIVSSTLFQKRDVL